MLTGAHCLLVRLDVSKSCIFDQFDLILDLLEFGGIQPDIFPIAVADPWADPSTNGFQHVLCGVDIWGTQCSLTSEVFADDTRVLANVAKVDCLAAPFEKQQAVEALKEE